MAIVDLRCHACGNAFQLVTRAAVKPQQKRCPSCGSEDIKQTFASYLRNGPLSSPACGAPHPTSYG
ncbi:MAG: FmdB family zinc ribbon protein [Thermoleophilia bacterium]